MLQKISVIMALLGCLISGCGSLRSSYRAVFVNDTSGAPVEVRVNTELCRLLTLTLTSEYYILGYRCGKDNVVNIHYPLLNMKAKEFNDGRAKDQVKTN